MKNRLSTIAVLSLLAAWGSNAMSADAVSSATVAVQAAPQASVDVITGATAKRESTSGAFSLSKTKAGQALLLDMARDFIWTGDSKFNGKTILGGRQMYSIATSYNNTPESITAELTSEFFPETGTFLFYGTTAKDSGKILRARKSGTGISVSWVKQLREDEVRHYGYNYYDSYGISFDADVEVITSDDINTKDKAHNKKVIKRLADILGKSMTTIKEWSLLWSFDPKLKGDALEKAQEAAIRDFMSYEDVYILKPRKMIVIAYFYRPLMVSDKNAFVYKEYALDSSRKGFNLATDPGYLAALRDTNCACTVSPKGRVEYNFFDAQYPADHPDNLINKLVAYKNTVLFGTANPEMGADPVKESAAKIESMYNKGGADTTLAEVNAKVKANPAKRATYYWMDKTKAENMPDRFMVTYTGLDSNGKAYRVDLPNWNRWFMLQPNNMCGIATRHTIRWN